MVNGNTSNSKSSRLFISKLVLENFKSYAGIVEVGPFHKSFSSVVGPNGSGKSNIIDSMLFVFGKRAKKLRLNKVSELIHNSEKYPNLKYASVSVYFSDIEDINDTEYRVVPGTELVVSRVAKDDNTSYYKVNGKRETWENVSKLLMKRGIDLTNNRFLILQGEVEQIAMMKPKGLNPGDEGLLEYLEDIIGSNKYLPLIEESEKILVELQEKRTEKLHRLKVAERDRDSLQAAKDEAEMFMNLESKVIDNNYKIYHKYQIEASERMSTQKQAVENSEKALKEHVKKIDAQKSDLKELEVQLRNSKKEFSKEKKLFDEKKAEFSVLEKMDVELREKQKHAKSKGKKAVSSHDKKSKQLTELEQTISDRTDDIERNEAKLQEVESKLEKEEAELEEMYAAIRKDIEPLSKKLDIKQREIQPFLQRLDKAKAESKNHEMEVKIFDEKLANSNSKLHTIKENIEKLSKEIPSIESELNSVSKSLILEEKTESSKKEEFIKLKEKSESLKSNIRDIMIKIKDAESINAENNSRGTVLEILLKIQGVHGRLGNLGSIDKKYDVAVSTAAGALEYIVVDNATVGQKCLEILREQNLGRCTFILLDKQESNRKRALKKFKTPEGAPRLIDLIKPSDSKYLGAFYYAVHDTLVAKDLTQGNRISTGSQRFRVVTLNGEMIEVSGAMSGGGKKISGRMGQGNNTREKVSEDQLKEWNMMLLNMEKELSSTRERIRVLESELKKSNIQNLEYKVRNFKIDLETKKSNLERYLSEKENLKTQVNLSPEEKKQYDSHIVKIEELKKVQLKEQQQSENLEKEIASIKNELEKVGGVTVRVKKARVENLKNDRKVASTAINRAKVLIKSNQKSLSKYSKEISQLEETIEAAGAEIKKGKEEIKNLEIKAAAVQEELNSIQEQMNEKESICKEIESRFTNLTKESKKVREAEIEFVHQAESCVASLKDSEAKYNAWTRKMKELSGKLSEDAANLSIENVKDLNINTLQNEIANWEDEIKRMSPNMAAIEEYRRKQKAYDALNDEFEKATADRDSERNKFDSLCKQRYDDFMDGFNQISKYLKEMYQMITLGGDAELELVDSLDPFSEGIIFTVLPPKKSWKNISNLSGGEKTLSSLALVFALHHYKPTPLYVMDEIDAALDFKNVSIVANYIKERTKNAQFLIISLRNNMFELADRLVGIYKTDNSTKTVTINPYLFAKTQNPNPKIANVQNDKVGNSSSSITPMINAN